ncbi:unnamed protein product [Echinostoma caproni]|uniref:Alpha-type protein kinase domain-containing protein n=1 Tax=Echinostoma caproni TaxID=27848 RepID=A0A183ARF0_9TREM|nr:unnamed protein product [Echinostoma caproni]
MMLDNQVDHAVQFDVDPRMANEKNNLFTQSQPCDVACRFLHYEAFLIKTSERMEDFNQLGEVYYAKHSDPENGICPPPNTEKHETDETQRTASSHGAI